MGQLQTPNTTQQQLQRARQYFADGGPLPADLLPSPLLRSWERSRAAGMHPSDAPNYQGQSRGNPREHADDRRLVASVQAEIEQLWQAFGGRDWTVFCVNPDGMIVHQRRHFDADEHLLGPIQTGRRIREIDVGTTAPACAMADGGPSLVHGNQHYLEVFAPVSCLSVPLYGIDGEVIGALDITGIGQRDTALMLAQFRLAALAAQTRLYAGLRDCHLLRLRYDARWADSPLQGVLAVRADGSVRAANRMARRLLGLSSIGPLPPLQLDELFGGLSVQKRRRLLQPGPGRRVSLPNGNGLWVDLWRAALARGTTRKALPPVAATTPGLREQALHNVQQALRENAGNVAATARQLGISRTTLYRKLDALNLHPVVS